MLRVRERWIHRYYYRYYYVWSWRPCFNTDNCNTQQFYGLHQGVDDDTATLNFATYTNWIQVHVQASENKGMPYNTGESADAVVMGPAGLGGGPGSCPSVWSSVFHWDTIAPWDGAVHQFQYDPCTQVRMWQ